MSDYNRRFLKRRGPTDIISFPAGSTPSPPGEKSDPLGDLLICMEIVKKHAKEHGQMVRMELARVIIHGTLHLLGYDHGSKKEAMKMKKREKELFHQVKTSFVGVIRS